MADNSIRLRRPKFEKHFRTPGCHYGGFSFVGKGRSTGCAFEPGGKRAVAFLERPENVDCNPCPKAPTARCPPDAEWMADSSASVARKRPRQIDCIVQKMQIEAARDFACAKFLQVRREPLGVEKGKAALAQPFDQRPERDLRRIPHMDETSTRQKTRRRSRPRKDRRRDRSPPGLDGMRVRRARADARSSR